VPVPAQPPARRAWQGQALDALQVVGAGIQQSGDAAKAVQKVLRQVQHALAGQAGAQQQGQQLHVAQGAGAAREQLLARAGVGGQVLNRHREGGAFYNRGSLSGTFRFS